MKTFTVEVNVKPAILKDYYKTLELSAQATQSDIKKSYRRLALLYHPDRNFGDRLAENKFKEIQEAYEALFDNGKRKTYDNNLNNRYANQRSRQSTNQDRPPLMPFTILALLQDLGKNTTYLEKTGRNQYDLFNRINSIIDNKNISFLLNGGDTKINNRIIDEVMLLLRLLSFPYVERIAVKLTRLAASDQEMIRIIQKFLKQKKLQSYFERYKGFIAITLVVIPFITLVLLTEKNTAYISPEQRLNRYLTSRYSQDTASQKLQAEYRDADKNNTATANSSADHSIWIPANYETGNTPDCYDFTPEYDLELNNYLAITIGSNTDAVIKLINTSTQKCIRYVYIKNQESYYIRNIPEGKYYLKIAYGKDWRRKMEAGKCTGQFVSEYTYKKWGEIPEFKKTLKSNSYQTASYSLLLGLVEQSPQESAVNSQISAKEFNED